MSCVLSVENLNFEDYCFRAAILKQPLHTYIHSEFFDSWFNIFVLPPASDREDLGYCLYSMDLSTERNARIMANPTPMRPPGRGTVTYQYVYSRAATVRCMTGSYTTMRSCPS